jgi:hypothetical protein
MFQRGGFMNYETIEYESENEGIGILSLKQAFYQQIEMGEKQAYQYGNEVISTNAVMLDAVEGMSSFFEKRTPAWKEK